MTLAVAQLFTPLGMGTALAATTTISNAASTVGGNVTMSSEGNYPAITNTGACTDNAGNVATAVTVGPFKLDLTKPMTPRPPPMPAPS